MYELCWPSADSHERDVLIMRHEVGVRYHQDRQVEKHSIDFVVYGDPHGYSAMAKTVGYPTAIATKMILDGSYCDVNSLPSAMILIRVSCNDGNILCKT